jgi:hypothetical protein
MYSRRLGVQKIISVNAGRTLIPQAILYQIAPAKTNQRKINEKQTIKRNESI